MRVVGSASSSGSVSVPDEVDEPRREHRWGHQYKLIQPIDEGGYGRVLLVEHLRTGDRVVLKEPLSNAADTLARFKREIEEQSKINHQNVMPILDYGDQLDWFCMPEAVDTLRARARFMNDEALERIS